MPSESSQQLSSISPGGVAPSRRKFDPRTVAPFHERSVSEETRRAYRRVVKEFFIYFKFRHPAEITSEDILAWREHLHTVKKRSASTIALKLSVIRSMYDYLQLAGHLATNPALTKLVPPPSLPEDLRGRALSSKEVRHLLSGPDRSCPEGARDYALLLLMLKTSLRVSEACGLKVSSVRWSHGRWVIKVRVKGGRERSMPLPAEVKQAIDEYLRIDRPRREQLHSGGPDSFIFQPVVNYRTLEFNKAISTQMAWQIVFISSISNTVHRPGLSLLIIRADLATDHTQAYSNRLR